MLENEGAISGTTEAPAGDLAGNASDAPQGTTQTAEPDAWSFAAVPGEAPPPDTATPPVAQPPEPPAPVEGDVQPDPAAQANKEFANPFEQTDARHGQFEGLRKHADTLLSEVKQYKPIAEKVKALGDPAVIDIVAPLMNIVEPGRTAVETAREVVDKFATYDPNIGEALDEAYYHKNRDMYFDWALEQKGIKPEDWQQFEAFRADPASFAPAGAGAMGTFPTPNPNKDDPYFGYVTITGPDGEPLTLNTTIPEANFMYQMAKRDHERNQADARARTETEARTRQEQVAAQRQGEVQRANNFAAQCDQDLDAAFAALPINVGNTPSIIPGLTETDLAKLITWGVARTWMDNDANHGKAFKQGTEVARRGGSGRSDSLRLNLQQSAKGHLEKAHQAVKAIFTELQGYRQAAGKGVLHEGPKIPADATVFHDTSVPNARPQPSQVARDPYDEIWQ